MPNPIVLLGESWGAQEDIDSLAPSLMLLQECGEMTHCYPVNLFWSDEDEGFIATAPDLPGSSAFGESQAEALAELGHAIEAWIEAAKAAGNPVPAVRKR